MGGGASAGFEGFEVDGEAVVLAGDLHLAGAQVLDRLVAAAVAEFEFVSGSAHGEAEELMAEADAKDGFLADEFFEGGLDVGDGFGIARAVGDEDAGGFVGEDFLGSGGGGDDGDLAAGLDEVAEDVALEAAINGDDVASGVVRFGVVVGELGPFAFALVPGVGLFGGDDFGEVQTGHAGPGVGAADEFGVVIYDGLIGAYNPFESTLDAEFAHQGPRIDAGDAGDVVAEEVFVEGFDGAEIGGDGGEFFNDEAFDLGMGGFVVGLIGDAVVTDLGVGHSDDLAGVGGIGEDFLVADEGGVEDGFAAAAGGGAESGAGEESAVFEGEFGDGRGHFGAPRSSEVQRVEVRRNFRFEISDFKVDSFCAWGIIREVQKFKRHLGDCPFPISHCPFGRRGRGCWALGAFFWVNFSPSFCIFDRVLLSSFELF